MFSYYLWERHKVRTLWAMPQSLMEQNRQKLLAFTGFKPEDVVILDTDFRRVKKSDPPNLPKKTRIKRIRSMEIDYLGVRTTAFEYLEARPDDVLVYAEIPDKPGIIWHQIGKRKPVGENCHQPADTTRVEPCRGPDGKILFKIVEREEEVVDLVAIHKEAKVFLCTFAFARAHWEHLFATIDNLKCFNVDEHHLGYKRPESQQTESFFHIQKRVDYSIMMTGSLLDGPLDSVFSAIHAIEPRYYGSYVGFLSQHADFVDDYGNVQTWRNTEKVKQILARHSAQITFKEAYGDEPMVHIHEYVQVGPKCREEYDTFHEQAMLELQDGRILDGSLPGPATIRARQILSHPETYGIAAGEETGKDQRIRIFASEGQTMLLFSSLIPEQERLVRLLRDEGLRVGLINAEVSRPQRNMIDQQFKNGLLDAVVASAATAGIGYDWPFLDHCIYVSPDYQDVNFIQGYRRGIRGQRDVPLRVTTLEYEDTIEGRQYQIISQKSELANSVDPSRPILRFAA